MAGFEGGLLLALGRALGAFRRASKSSYVKAAVMSRISS